MQIFVKRLAGNDIVSEALDIAQVLNLEIVLDDGQIFEFYPEEDHVLACAGRSVNRLRIEPQSANSIRLTAGR